MSCTFWGSVAAGSSNTPEGCAIYLASGSLVGTNAIAWGNTPNGVEDSGGVRYTWATFSDLHDGVGPPENNNKRGVMQDDCERIFSSQRNRLEM
jgi:hypothetical protein